MQRPSPNQQSLASRDLHGSGLDLWHTLLTQTNPVRQSKCLGGRSPLKCLSSGVLPAGLAEPQLERGELPGRPIGGREDLIEIRNKIQSSLYDPGAVSSIFCIFLSHQSRWSGASGSRCEWSKTSGTYAELRPPKAQPLQPI
jgi:hypothetical protein